MNNKMQYQYQEKPLIEYTDFTGQKQLIEGSGLGGDFHTHINTANSSRSTTNSNDQRVKPNLNTIRTRNDQYFESDKEANMIDLSLLKGQSDLYGAERNKKLEEIYKVKGVEKKVPVDILVSSIVEKYDKISALEPEHNDVRFNIMTKLADELLAFIDSTEGKAWFDNIDNRQLELIKHNKVPNLTPMEQKMMTLREGYNDAIREKIE